jgi:hypothetical protein
MTSQSATEFDSSKKYEKNLRDLVFRVSAALRTMKKEKVNKNV